MSFYGRGFILNSSTPGEGGEGGAVDSVAGKTGVVTLVPADVVGLTTALGDKAPLVSPTFTGTVAGVSKAMVGLGSVDNVSDADKPVSSAAATALALKAPLASPTFTGTVAGVTKAMVGLGSVDNTTDVGKPVSSAQQAALDAKAPLASPTFTGTVAGITKTMVGLGSVDNTADTAKPVSTAQQTALNLKANLAGPTFTGTVTVPDASFANAKLATMAQSTIKGRAASAGTGVATDLSAAQVRTLINVADGATANAADATLLARGSHTGTQLASTISDFTAAVEAVVGEPSELPDILQQIAASTGTGPYLFGRDAAGDLAEIATSTLAPATVYDWLLRTAGLSGTGEAAARSRLYTSLALVGDTAILALPSTASPDLTLARLVSTDRTFMLALAEPEVALEDLAFSLALAVTNTSGAAVTMHIAPLATGRAAVYLHADHAGALPTILAGETAYFDVSWQSGVAVVQRMTRTPAFRRMLPRLASFLVHSNAAWTIPGNLQKANDLLFEIAGRQNATPPGSPAGFSALPTPLVAAHVTNHSTRVTFRIATADNEASPVGTNTSTRSIGVLVKDIDPVNPIISNTAWSTTTGTPITIPAHVITEPGLIVPLFVANKDANTPGVHNVPPSWAEQFFFEESPGGDDLTYWMGSLAGSFSSPSATVVTNSGTAGGGGAVIALRGKEIPA